MGHPRAPLSVKNKRTVEEAEWKESWEKFKPRKKRRSIERESEAMALLTELHNQMGRCSKALELTLRILKALGLDGRYWKRNLSKLPKASWNEDKEAIMTMRFLVIDRGWKATRAAQYTLATRGLFRQMTWPSAVKHCRELWANNKAQNVASMPPDSSVHQLIIAGPEPTWGLFDHPSGVLPFGKDFGVENSNFWREAIERGVVSTSDDNEADDFWVKVIQRDLVQTIILEKNETLLLPTLRL